MTVTASLLVGALVGLANAASAVWTAHRATALRANPALWLALGGMVVRMAATLAVVGLVLALFDVHRAAFVGGLGVLFVAGLFVEIALVAGRASTPAPADA